MSKPERGEANTKKKTSDHGNKECPDSMTQWVADLLKMPIICETTQPLEKVKETKREEPCTRTIWNSDDGQIPGKRNCPLDNENRKRLLIANVMLGNLSVVNSKILQHHEAQEEQSEELEADRKRSHELDCRTDYNRGQEIHVGDSLQTFRLA
jgi:hypothetical protein